MGSKRNARRKARRKNGTTTRKAASNKLRLKREKGEL